MVSSRATPTPVVVNRNSTFVRKPARAVNGEAGTESGPPDPEALRIRDELTRLHNDAEARRVFYEDLRRTVQQVRAGVRSEDAAERGENSPNQNDSSSWPGATSSTEVRTGSSDFPPTDDPRESPSKDPDEPQALLNSSGGEIDRAAYLMVVRWAKANGTPVSLALGVAWMESHLNPHPARGAAGEAGMFQIMPERCTLEGWPARRLKEPEFNAWMGTMLLARYYQEEGSVARAAAKYVAGPGVFDKKYSKDVWAYINWYASTVNSYASYFSRYQT